jgi:hypothetical protein
MADLAALLLVFTEASPDSSTTSCITGDILGGSGSPQQQQRRRRPRHTDAGTPSPPSRYMTARDRDLRGIGSASEAATAVVLSALCGWRPSAGDTHDLLDMEPSHVAVPSPMHLRPRDLLVSLLSLPHLFLTSARIVGHHES